MVSLIEIVFILLLHSKSTDQHLYLTKSARATVREPIALLGEARQGRGMNRSIEIYRYVEHAYLHRLNPGM